MTKMEELTEQHREAVKRKTDLFKVIISAATVITIIGLTWLAMYVYSGRQARDLELAEIKEQMKTFCRITSDKDPSTENACNKIERDEPVTLRDLPDLNDPELQDIEVQDSELQEREEQEPEVQDAEEQNAEIDDGDPTDNPEIQESEVQEPEVQEDETQDPEIDDPDPSIPGPSGPQGPQGVGIADIDWGMSGAQCILQIILTNGEVESFSLPLTACLP